MEERVEIYYYLDRSLFIYLLVFHQLIDRIVILIYSELGIGLRPWLLLLVPNVALLYIMLSSYQTSKSTKPTGSYTSITNPAQMFASQATPPALAAEGSREWLANVQGLQNLMGFLCASLN